MTNTIVETNYLKNSAALEASHEEALTICHDILEGKEATKKLNEKVAKLSDQLFSAVKTLCKNEGISVEEAFNNLAFMMGYNYTGDPKTGAPDTKGDYIKKGEAWPKGTLSTYRAQMNKFDKEHGGIAEAPTFTEMKKTVNPKQDDPLLDAIKAMRKEWAEKPETLKKMEKDLLSDIRAGIEFEIKRLKDIEAAAKKAAEAPAEAPAEVVAEAEKAIAEAAAKKAAAPKSNAKKKAA